MQTTSPSRYRDAGVIQSGTSRYFGLRPTYDVSPRTSDLFYDVRSGDTLQLVAYRSFGDHRLWWVVADFNEILDPFEELVPGSQLRIPSQARLWMEVLR